MPAPPPYVSHSAFSDTLRRPTTGFDSSTAPTKKRIGSTRKSSVRTVNKKKRIKGERGKERIFRDCIGMGTQSGVCDARCLNYTETWLGGSFSSSKGKGPKIVGDSSPHEMNKNIIGLDKPASWRNVREKPGGCALFKRGVDIYFFIFALKYVFSFFFFSRRFSRTARWLFSRTIM